ncbi:hypothetical protein NDU88_004673 [Pleurodeles waltl]|uniref:Uncharacterized protein n=1 Tax=Pleurodeles waltl TaxID=8319 RepID=A0AAV7KYL9_PLEWA|nr:hypothetical protein NDU88_004673 [Pleurodeles waltl]
MAGHRDSGSASRKNSLHGGRNCAIPALRPALLRQRKSTVGGIGEPPGVPDLWPRGETHRGAPEDPRCA